MTFGQALEALTSGGKLRRAGWNGEGMFIAFMPGFVIPAGMVNGRTAKFVPPDQDIQCEPYIALWTAQGTWQPGWRPTSPDLFATDWEVVQ